MVNNMSKDNSKPLLWMIIPCYNEEEVLPITSKQFLELLDRLIDNGKISFKSRILFVNDGSADTTWDIIKKLSQEDEHFIGISQSRNRGHQSSLVAGLMEARGRCDVTVSIDCDGQDDIHAIEEMIDEYLAGSEIVYGVRSNRDTDSFFKRNTATGFYKFMGRMGVESVYNHADYRLVSSKALDAFADFEEVNMFLRGIFPLVGFKSSVVYYERQKRLGGKSHYPLSKMIHLAMDGITSMSTKPLSVIAGIGCFVSMVGFIGILWAIIEHMTGNAVSGWASTICIICFMGGIQLISLGVIGQYIGRIYLETKHRPRYIISERTWEKNDRNYMG